VALTAAEETNCNRFASKVSKHKDNLVGTTL
jgi:hypothetical protein